VVLLENRELLVGPFLRALLFAGALCCAPDGIYVELCENDLGLTGRAGNAAGHVQSDESALKMTAQRRALDKIYKRRDRYEILLGRVSTGSFHCLFPT
jgi:hypothetical protein